MDEPTLEELQEKQRILEEFLDALNEFITGLVRGSDREYQRFSQDFRRLRRILTMDQIIEIDREAAAISKLERGLVPVTQAAVEANLGLRFLAQYVANLEDDDRKRDALMLTLLILLYAISLQFRIARGSLERAREIERLPRKLAI